MTIKFPELLFYRLLLLILMPALLVGCQSQKVYKIQTKLLIPNKEEGKIPLRAGLYLDPKFLNYVKDPGINYFYKVDMGEALSKGTQYIVEKAFKEVIVVYTLDIELIPKGLDVLVMPEIDKIYEFGEENIRKKSGTATVRIKWTITDMNRKILYTNIFTGEAIYKKWPLAAHPEENPEGYARALDDQFTKAYLAITSSNWWESLKNKRATD